MGQNISSKDNCKILGTRNRIESERTNVPLSVIFCKWGAAGVRRVNICHLRAELENGLAERENTRPPPTHLHSMYIEMAMHAITSTAQGNSPDAITATIKDASLCLEIWLAYLETKLK